MATQTLIIANTNPTVEVYKIIDGANTYILAQDGYSTNAPNTVSIQVDYSSYLDRIATALESIATSALYQATDVGIIKNSILSTNSSLETIATKITSMTDSANSSSESLQVLAGSFEVERAINVADLKFSNFNDDDFDQFDAVKDEINNPTQF